MENVGKWLIFGYVFCKFSDKLVEVEKLVREIGNTDTFYDELDEVSYRLGMLMFEFRFHLCVNRKKYEMNTERFTLIGTAWKQFLDECEEKGIGKGA